MYWPDSGPVAAVETDATRAFAARQAEARASEDVVVRALVEMAATCGDEERAALRVQYRGEPEDEGERIARDHGFGPDRLIAMKGLARSRGASLEEVLRHALRGDLREIVMRPAVRPRRTESELGR